MLTTSQTGNEFKELDVSVAGKRLSARVGGSGAPIVLFHSLLADQSSFDRITDELAYTHQVFVLNLPGFGSSDFVGPDLPSIADHIASCLKAMGVKNPILLGNGYGGFVALQLTIRHPDYPRRLVLADCGAAFSDTGRAAFRGMSATANDKGLSAIADVAMRRLFAPEFQQQNPDLTAQRKERFLAVDSKTFHGACDALASLDLRDDLQRVTCPVLVVVGEMDEATPPPMSHELNAGLPHSELVVLQGCAHVPQLQAPTQFMAAIQTFIQNPI